MGNEQGGLACPAVPEVIQNDLLGAGIHRRDGVIQDQDGRVLEQGAGDAVTDRAGLTPSRRARPERSRSRP